jgi:hypothetical protein
MSVLWRRVDSWVDTNVSEKHSASILSAEVPKSPHGVTIQKKSTDISG